VESGEGIERRPYRPAAGSVGRNVWNPVKELKVDIAAWFSFDTPITWNPVKELKVARRDLEDRTRRLITWNPVKELKENLVPHIGHDRASDVESGEGIESDIFRSARS